MVARMRARSRPTAGFTFNFSHLYLRIADDGSPNSRRLPSLSNGRWSGVSACPYTISLQVSRHALMSMANRAVGPVQSWGGLDDMYNAEEVRPVAHQPESSLLDELLRFTIPVATKRPGLSVGQLIL